MSIKEDDLADERYVCPKEAEKKFKLAQGMRQTVYLYGITGSGKTAFVKNMLKRKHYSYYTARETSAEKLNVSDNGKFHIIVVDNLQDVLGEMQRDEYTNRLRELSVRRDVWLILISRCRIPQWLMSIHVESTFFVIREKDLQLDRMEQDAYFEKWNIELPLETADQIWKFANGNPLFCRFVALAGGDVKQAGSDMLSYLFYIYDQWDLELQEFLFEMSVVERFDAGMAQMVTGRSDVQKLLKRAMETGSFLKEKDGLYELNFIFKDRIQDYLGRKFDQEQIARMYYNAGHMYEIYEDIPNALRMYEAGDDQRSNFRLLVSNARQNPAAGHYFELRRYYLMLPEESIRTSPVLMAGMSMLQSMLMNPEESERWYQMLEDFAAENRGSAGREARNRLLYLDIGLPHRGIVQIEDLLKHAYTLLRDGKTILPEFSVTSNLPSIMNGGKDFCEWSRRDKQLAASIGKIVEFVLGKYGKGLVSLALAESGFEKGVDTYEIVSLAEKGRMQADVGGKAEQVFVAVGILVWLSVINGRGEDAQDILESFRQKIEKEVPQLLPNLYALRCRIYLYQGKIPQVLEWMDIAPDENKDFCSLDRLCYLTKIRCYIQFGKYDKAYGLLQKMTYYAKVQKRMYVYMETRLLLAVVKYRMKEDGWQALLQECITQAEDYHFVRLITREGGAVLKLLKAESFRWEDESYQKQVVLECQQMYNYYPSYLKEKTDEEIVLSKNALNILRPQAEGYKTSQIAEILNITSNTIKYHSKETYRKLGVSNKAAAVSEAKNRGLI